MLTVASIISRACSIAKCPQYTAIALDLFNSILSDLCIGNHDFAVARGLFSTVFNPGLTSNYGSGPYNLPLDYLRASGSSGEGQKTFWWTLQGVPYPMVPCDLSDFDMQVQQAGNQSYPWLMATDMANASQAISSRYRSTGAVGLTINSAVATPASMVMPGSTLPAYVVGDGIAGEGIVPGTTILAVVGPALTLSNPATATVAAASCMAGIAPQFYVYPPPSGAYPVTIRYQRAMPPILDVTKFPWFPDEGYLVTALAGRLMEVTDDSRVTEFIGDGQRPGRADRRLREYLQNSDDKRNRPQIVELDRRTFGSSFRSLPNTKTTGW